MNIQDFSQNISELLDLTIEENWKDAHDLLEIIIDECPDKFRSMLEELLVLNEINSNRYHDILSRLENGPQLTKIICIGALVVERAKKLHLLKILIQKYDTEIIKLSIIESIKKNEYDIHLKVLILSLSIQVGFDSISDVSFESLMNDLEKKYNHSTLIKCLTEETLSLYFANLHQRDCIKMAFWIDHLIKFKNYKNLAFRWKHCVLKCCDYDKNSKDKFIRFLQLKNGVT